MILSEKKDIYLGAETVLPCTKANLVLKNAYVKVKDGKIAEVGSIESLTAKQKGGLKYYENATLMPGLINAHEHLVTKSYLTPWTLDRIISEPIAYQTVRASKNAQGLLREGITTLRECGCRERINIGIANAVKAGLIQAPDILACGMPISIIGGHCSYYSYQVSSSAEVVRAVRSELMMGADFIKVHATGGAGTLEGDPRNPQLSFEELKAAADEAHRENKRVCSHAIGRQGIKNSILAGIDTVEHGQYLDAELLEMMTEKKTYYVPTLTGYIPLARHGLEMGRPAWMVEKAKMLLEAHQNVMMLIKKYPEIVIGVGTDSSGRMADEIAELTATGFSNGQALLFATRNSADVLGILNEVGTLEPGKKANLAVFAGDLTNDIRGLNVVKAVIKAGQCIM